MEILKIENLNFTYPEQSDQALKGITLNIHSGEFVVICGESGCGKTTLLRLLKRELSPHGEKQGKILYQGVDTTELDDRAAACDIGYVMQNPDNQLVTDKVWHELAFGLENQGLPTPVIRRKVGEIACFFGIDHMFRKENSLLSGGQKQLLNLASIMVMSPKILILDEPTAQLDPIAASEFISTLVRINKELGTTIILVEHRLEEVFSLADRVAVMEEGRVLFFDTPWKVGKLLRDMKSPHKMLLGLPSAARIYNGLNIEDNCPITVREGRSFLTKHFTSLNSRRESQPNGGREENIPGAFPVLEIKNIWFRYERELPDILEGVSLTAYKGDFISLLGGNGSGKTTLLKVISNQVRAYKGSIKIFEKKLKNYKGNSLYKNTLALLPQNPQSLFLEPKLQEDYQEVCSSMGYSDEEGKKQVKRISELLGISHLMDKNPYDLSGGEQQKAALGKILLQKPKIILLDEPTKGLDAYSKDVLSNIIRGLRKEGITIIMVTHDLEFAAENSSGCAMIFDGGLSPIEKPVDFFSGNQFYTTAANRIVRNLNPYLVTCDEIIEACRKEAGIN